jgi:hypothetical protein
MKPSDCTIEQNVAARKAADALMGLGIDLAKEEGLDAEHVRLMWQRVIELVRELIGEDDNEKDNEPEPSGIVFRVINSKNDGRLTDDDIMPWGKYRGERLGDVPDDYLDWLGKQDWIEDHPDLLEYIDT